MSSNEIASLQSVATTHKPSRVRKFKEDYVNEVTILRMDNHALAYTNKKLLSANASLGQLFDNPTIAQAVRLLFKAVVRKVRGV